MKETDGPWSPTVWWQVFVIVFILVMVLALAALMMVP
jgi:hypothetical protein